MDGGALRYFAHAVAPPGRVGNAPGTLCHFV
jgi:hypothetical protein